MRRAFYAVLARSVGYNAAGRHMLSSLRWSRARTGTLCAKTKNPGDRDSRGFAPGRSTRSFRVHSGCRIDNLWDTQRPIMFADVRDGSEMNRAETHGRTSGSFRPPSAP